MTISTICHDDHLRREQVRARSGWNGLDYLEVIDERTLIVYFLGKAPEQFEKQGTETAYAYGRRVRGYLRIEGGRRVRDIQVTEVELRRGERDDEDDRLIVRVDRSGDFSTYMLVLQGVENIDPRYTELEFTFKVDCPSDLDCLPLDDCPPPQLGEPDINYLAKDYASFRQLILDRLALIMPDWKERHAPDIGIALVEVLAYAGDYLSYYQDAVATEAYLDTARQRISVYRHARLVDHIMHQGCNARAWLCVEVDGKLTLDPNDVRFLTGVDDPNLTLQTSVSPEQLNSLPSQSYEVFEPVNRTGELRFRQAHNQIEFYTWGERECCLPRGATSATLMDGAVSGPEPAPTASATQSQQTKQKQAPEQEQERKLDLRVGDILIFEEIRGPKTGVPADADPTRRHAVRLTSVQSKVSADSYDPGAPTKGLTDPLTDQPIVEIEWAEEDALPFPLCLSAVTDAEHDCKYHEGISIARGNVILVDHGQTFGDSLGVVPTESTEVECECEGRLGEVRYVPGRFRPILVRTPLTFSASYLPELPAATQLMQDLRRAYAKIWLMGGREGDTTNPDVPSCVRSEFEKFQILSRWMPRLDLLDSRPDDFHFAVEIDNEGRTHLRFGDGKLGRQPEAGTEFRAIYRIGNGVRGNVGAGAIRHITWCLKKPDGIVSVRNPFPAYGGRDPEPITEAKLFAPGAFRKRLQRAIIAEDYAVLAQSEYPSKVQRAAGSLDWNGSWYEAQVAIDQFGRSEADPLFLRELEARLFPYVRIGHDLRVESAQLVPLDIRLDICVRSNYQRAHVKAALLEVFGNRKLLDGSLGFFHPDNLTFGENIYLSKLVATAMAVPGVESAVVTVLNRYGEPARDEIEDGVLSLGRQEIAQVDNDPSFPEHGRLVLAVGGGR